MTDIFYSPRLTLVRAQQHIQNFNALVNDFVDGHPWAYVPETDPDTGEHIHKIKFTRQLPQMLPCILFDIASNLRATLDQAGYSSALASGNIRLTKTNFPFADTTANLDNNIDGRRVCEDLPPEITTLFRGFKPYKGGNDPLWALNKLCNTKKHCRLVPIGIERALVFFTSDVIGAGWSSNTVSPTSTGLGWNAEKGEVTLQVTPPGVTPKITADVSFNIAIDGIETIVGEQAAHVLHAMSGIVERILLATEAECRSLGFQIE
jgi:hypothetical protein